MRLPIAVGDTWTNTWTTGGVSGTSDFAIERREPIEAFGQTWDAVVISNHTEMSGDANGTQDSMSWYVVELGLDIKRISELSGRYQGIPFELHDERVLTARS